MFLKIHKFLDYSLFVEADTGFVSHAMGYSNGEYKCFLPHRWSIKSRCWVIADRLTLAAFRSGYSRGSIQLS
jgi:hypothetical protein